MTDDLDDENRFTLRDKGGIGESVEIKVPLLASHEGKEDQPQDENVYQETQEMETETEGRAEIVKLVEARKKVLANYTMLMDTA